MKKAILCVRDIKANYHMDPFLAPHVGGAIREFGDLCTGAKEHPFAAHPEDYELLELGVWDDADASIERHETPRQLAAGSNYRKN